MAAPDGSVFTIPPALFADFLLRAKQLFAGWDLKSAWPIECWQAHSSRLGLFSPLPTHWAIRPIEHPRKYCKHASEI
jgi:hypothetical protein